jgi:hypothetical protein
VIAKGIREIEAGVVLAPGRQRRPGAGRKRITEHDPELVAALDALIEPDTVGDPDSPLRWVCKSTRVLAAELARRDHPISHVKLAQLLHAQKYSLQGTRKTGEGADHPDRDAQFRYINRCVTRALAAATRCCPWIRRRRDWSGTTPIPAASGVPCDRRRVPTRMTSRRPTCRGRIRTGSMTSAATRGS